MEDGTRVKALLRRNQGAVEVSGRLGPFLIENGRLRVRLDRIEPETVPEREAWFDAGEILAPDPLVLRSEIWEVPSGPERDVILRSLTVTLSEHLYRFGSRIELARGQAGIVELLFYHRVPLAEGAAYQAGYASVRLRCRPRPVPWRPPKPILASKSLAAGERHHSHISHLPLWLEANALWSVYILERGELFHALQFSLDERHQGSLISRFRLKRAPHLA